MKNLLELKDQLDNELDDDEIIDSESYDKEEEEDDDEGEDSSDSEEMDSPDKTGIKIIRVDNQDRVKGRISKLEFEIGYKDLSDKINEKVSGLMVTKIKARQIMDVVRDIMGF